MMVKREDGLQVVLMRELLDWHMREAERYQQYLEREELFAYPSPAWKTNYYCKMNGFHSAAVTTLMQYTEDGDGDAGTHRLASHARHRLGK